MATNYSSIPNHNTIYKNTIYNNFFVPKSTISRGGLVTLVPEWEKSSHFSPWMLWNCKTIHECRLC